MKSIMGHSHRSRSRQLLCAALGAFVLVTAAAAQEKPASSPVTAQKTFATAQAAADALSALRRMFDDGEIASMGAAHAILGLRGLASAKQRFIDRLIHAAYTAGGGRMATFERASGRLGAVTLLR